MGRTNVLGTLGLTAIAVCSYAASQDLGQQIHGVYLETSMDPNGMKVVKPGSTLVVQIDGVLANPLKNNLQPFDNNFENGQLVVPEGRMGKLARFGGISLPKKHPEKPLANGAKVYLLKVEFLPAEDSISLTVQTCGDCDPKVVDPMNEPYRAKVTFKFVHGALAVTDLKHVRQGIDQVFKFPDASAEGGNGGAAQGNGQSQEAPPPPQPQPAAQTQQSQQQFSAIPPPPPPPAAPRTLKVGMTIDEVKAAYGEPANIVDLGNNKLIYLYKDKKITFVNGKVSDVDVL